MPKVIVIVGPTGVGKTALSIALAKKLDGEIINADSTQVYKGLDIATAKVTKEEREGILHHLFDICLLDEDYTVFDYQKDCRAKIDEILKRGHTPILVGGTGLYIKAALYDYTFESENNHKDYSMFDNKMLYQKLLEVDPNTDIHPNNRKRVERALQYYEVNHEPISQKKKAETLLYDTVFIGLTTDRSILYDRINKRVSKMMNDGLLEEARQVYNTNIRSKAILTPIGYKELFEYFENRLTLEDALNLIRQRSRNYAKRQYTWFHNQMDINWFTVSFDDFNITINEVLEYIKKRS